MNETFTTPTTIDIRFANWRVISKSEMASILFKLKYVKLQKKILFYKKPVCLVTRKILVFVTNTLANHC